jgi:glycosyltransferase involved in cell wall biosynthesis
VEHSDRSLLIADAVRVFGGAERFVLDAARGLGRRGWRVTVLAYPGSPLHQRARALDLDVHTARTRANGAPWTVLPLVAWFRRRRFDAVLSVYDKDLRTAAWAARLAHTSTAVVHGRECDTPLKDRPWIRAFHRRVADRIVVNSEATRSTTLRSAPWLDPERVAVVPKGIDVERFTPADRPGDAGRAVLGFAGQLVARKRVDLLIDALRSLPAGTCLRIAGDGPERSTLEERARRAGVDVRFDGFVTDVDEWYEQIDVFVLPSRVEGWGYVLAEAAAAGRAIVAFDSSSVPEVVPSAAGACLVDADDDLAPTLARLVAEGPEGWRARGRNLRRHAVERLGLDRMLENLENEIFVAVSSRRGGAAG